MSNASAAILWPSSGWRAVNSRSPGIGSGRGRCSTAGALKGSCVGIRDQEPSPLLVSPGLDPEGLRQAIHYRFVVGDTMLRGVSQVLPASFVRVTPGREPVETHYWRLASSQQIPAEVLDAWTDRTDAGLEAFMGRLKQLLEHRSPAERGRRFFAAGTEGQAGGLPELRGADGTVARRESGTRAGDRDREAHRHRASRRRRGRVKVRTPARRGSCGGSKSFRGTTIAWCWPACSSMRARGLKRCCTGIPPIMFGPPDAVEIATFIRRRRISI